MVISAILDRKEEANHIVAFIEICRYQLCDKICDMHTFKVLISKNHGREMVTNDKKL